MQTANAYILTPYSVHIIFYNALLYASIDIQIFAIKCINHKNKKLHTTPLKALRRKKALQDSHEIASKLYPSALSPHTPQILSSLFFLPDLLLPDAAPSTPTGMQ